MSDAGALARSVIMCGIDGATLDPSLPRFGGYLLFGGAGVTVREIRTLTDALRAREDQPLIAIDQEGGRVARLREGVEAMPPMMSLGAAGDVELARRAGEQVAFDLRRAGCTLDFAPVLDLALERENVVIGTRSLGDDPRRVAALGQAFAAGLQSGGVVPCYKHFPGHGATAIDSHESLPLVDTDAATLRARDLLPFAAVARSAAAMMSAHVVVRALDPDNPATLSSRIANDLLRGELGFGGAFVTDCLEMGALASRDPVDVGVGALAAGADLLVFSHDAERATRAAAAVEKALLDGRLAPDRVRESSERVCRLREAGAAPLALDEFPPHPGVGREIARRAVTLIRGLPHADPVASTLVSFGSEGRTLEREAPALDEFLASADPARDESDAMLAALAAEGRRPLVLARRPHRYAGQAHAIARIIDRYPDALVVSLGQPFDVPLFRDARHLLAVYGSDAASLRGLADVIFGGSMPTGELPVAI